MIKRTTHCIFLFAAIIFLSSCGKQTNDDLLDQHHVYYNHTTWSVINVNFGIQNVSWVGTDISDTCRVVYVDSTNATTTQFVASYGYSTDGPAQKDSLYHKVLSKKIAEGITTTIVRGQIWTNTQDSTDQMTRVVGINPIVPGEENLRIR